MADNDRIVLTGTYEKLPKAQQVFVDRELDAVTYVQDYCERISDTDRGNLGKGWASDLRSPKGDIMELEHMGLAAKAARAQLLAFKKRGLAAPGMMLDPQKSWEQYAATLDDALGKDYHVIKNQKPFIPPVITRLAGDHSYVEWGEKKLQTASMDNTLVTTGMSACCSVVIVNETRRTQAMVHLLPEETQSGSVKAYASALRADKIQYCVVSGCNDKAAFNVYKGLRDAGVAKEDIRYVPWQDNFSNSQNIAVQGGKITRADDALAEQVWAQHSLRMMTAKYGEEAPVAVQKAVKEAWPQLQERLKTIKASLKEPAYEPSLTGHYSPQFFLLTGKSFDAETAKKCCLANGLYEDKDMQKLMQDIRQHPDVKRLFKHGKDDTNRVEVNRYIGYVVFSMAMDSETYVQSPSPPQLPEKEPTGTMKDGASKPLHPISAEARPLPTPTGKHTALSP